VPWPAIAPAHRPQTRTQIGAHGIQQRFAESQPASRIPDERRKNVPLAQGQPDGCAQGLLAASEEDAAMDFAHAIKAGEFVIQDAGQEHDAVGFDIGIT